MKKILSAIIAVCMLASFASTVSANETIYESGDIIEGFAGIEGQLIFDFDNAIPLNILNISLASESSGLKEIVISDSISYVPTYNDKGVFYGYTSFDTKNNEVNGYVEGDFYTWLNNVQNDIIKVLDISDYMYVSDQMFNNNGIIFTDVSGNEMYIDLSSYYMVKNEYSANELKECGCLYGSDEMLEILAGRYELLNDGEGSSYAVEEDNEEVNIIVEEATEENASSDYENIALTKNPDTSDNSKNLITIMSVGIVCFGAAFVISTRKRK